MNNVPTGRLCDTAAEKNAKVRRGSKIRAIDQGTLYDVPGKLRRLVREIEKGDLGRVTDVVNAVRIVKDGKVSIRTMYTGTSDMPTLKFMVDRLGKELID
jgi:hypothetical protein